MEHFDEERPKAHATGSKSRDLQPIRPPVRVINIAGVGRSGSTLLGQMLAADPAAVFVGETQHIWSKGYGDNARCGCHLPFSDCPLWADVDKDAFDGLPRSRAPGLIELQKRVLRERGLLSMLAPGWGHGLRLDDDRMWLEYRTVLMHSIAKVSGADTIVDTSKDHLFGLALSHVPGIELHVVHLLRDPRAVAFSWQRQVVQDQYPDQVVLLQQPSIPIVSRQWVVQTIAIATLLRRRAASYTELRYEDFVADPQTTVDRIRQNAGMGLGPEFVDLDGSVELRTLGHPIAGNPGRRTAGRRLTMRLDNEWQSAMPKPDQLRVIARCGPLMLRHGYRVRP